jgi:two-component system response regulator YesN
MNKFEQISSKQNSGGLSDQVAEFVLRCADREIGQLSVSKLARIFNVSESFLSRKFRADKKFTIGKFIFKERMFRAAVLLRKDDRLTIKSLSEIVGFLDYEYFLRVFKDCYGVTPSRYRNCTEGS